MPDIFMMWQAIAETVPNLTRLLMAIAYVSGLFLIVRSLLLLKNLVLQKGSTQSSQPIYLSDIILMMVVGSALLYLPSTIDIFTHTFFSDANPYSYVINELDVWHDFLKVAQQVLQFMGILSIVRGLYAFLGQGKSSQEKGYSSACYRGVMHIVSGVMCMHVIFLLQVILSQSVIS